MRQSNRVLAVRGRSCRPRRSPLTLHAELADGSHLEGQSRIVRARGIRRVWISPRDVEASARGRRGHRAPPTSSSSGRAASTRACCRLLVPGIRDALEGARGAAASTSPTWPRSSARPRATRSPSTSRRWRARASATLIDVVLANDDITRARAGDYPAAPVRIDLPLAVGTARGWSRADVVDPDNAHRHDPRSCARWRRSGCSIERQAAARRRERSRRADGPHGRGRSRAPTRESTAARRTTATRSRRGAAGRAGGDRAGARLLPAAERPGLGPRPRAGRADAVVARLAVRLERRRAPTPRPSTGPRRADHCRAGLAARPLPGRGSLSLGDGRHAPRARRAARGGGRLGGTARGGRLCRPACGCGGARAC